MLILGEPKPPTRSKDVQADMCKCNKCMKEFKVSDCDTDTDTHDGWEMPAYTIHFCPECPNEEIDNYFLSGDLFVTWTELNIKERQAARAAM